MHHCMPTKHTTIVTFFPLGLLHLHCILHYLRRVAPYMPNMSLSLMRFIGVSKRFGYLNCDITIEDLINKYDFDLLCKMCMFKSPVS